jgi:hypothetical protein
MSSPFALPILWAKSIVRDSSKICSKSGAHCALPDFFSLGDGVDVLFKGKVWERLTPAMPAT